MLFSAFSSKRAFQLAVLFSAALLGACAIGEGVSPTCNPDVTKQGHDYSVDDGCNPFAVCLDDMGRQADPDKEPNCCGDIPPGCSHEECLYGYGVEVDLAKSCGKGAGSGGGGSGG